MKINKNVCRIIFDFASKDKHAGKDATLSREFFLVVASAYPEHREHIEVLKEVSKEWRASKKKPTKLRQRLIGNIQQQGRRINEMLEPVFGDAISIANIPGLAWQLTLTDKFSEGIQKSESKQELLTFLKDWLDRARGREESVPVAKFVYLQPIEDVLRITEEVKAEWFRKAGPLAVDFDRGMVYRRKNMLGSLRRLVLGNSASILVGESATGKTVLVRNFAYELRCEGITEIYHFSCDLDRQFDPHVLASEINDIKGIVIIEDVHIAPHEMQSVYSRLEQTSSRHVLFTARPSLSQYEYSRTRTFGDVPHLDLKPFDDVDGIIEHYVENQPDLILSSEVREDIKRVSERSFWLLAYALDGYVSMDSKGDPESLLEAGVTDDLKNLKTKNSHFPEALLAVSALYRSETLTVQHYLTDRLNIDIEILSALVRQGDMTCQKGGDNVFYGLPHSGLAVAYWKYGGEYLNPTLRNYESFLYDYAVSMPDGLGAVVVRVFDESIRSKLLSRLDAAGEMRKLVAQASLESIWWLVLETGSAHMNDEIIEDLARKLSKPNDLGYGSSCLEVLIRKVGTGILQRLDLEQLASHLTSLNHTEFLIDYINPICEADEKIGKELLGLLDLRELSDYLFQDSVRMSYLFMCAKEDQHACIRNMLKELCVLLAEHLDAFGDEHGAIIPAMRINEEMGLTILDHLKKEKLKNIIQERLQAIKVSRGSFQRIAMAATNPPETVEE